MALGMALTGASALAEIGYNVYRGIKADKALKELQKKRTARYMDAAGPLQQNLAMARRQYEQGLDPQSIGLAKQTTADQMASRYRGITNIAGGSMGSAIARLAGQNVNQLGLSLGTANQAAKERGMQNMFGINQMLSGLQQRDVQQDIYAKQLQEQNYGLAKQQAIRSGFGALSAFGQAALYNDYYKGAYGNQKTPDTTSTTTPTTTTTTTPTSGAPSWLMGGPNAFPYSSSTTPASKPTMPSWMMAEPGTYGGSTPPWLMAAPGTYTEGPSFMSTLPPTAKGGFFNPTYP